MSIKENFLNKSNSYIFYKENYENLSKKHVELLKKIDDLNKKLDKKNKELDSISKELNKEKIKHENEVNQLYENFHLIIESINNLHNNVNIKLDDASLKAKEINYAFIFNDTIAESTWLKKRNFSLNNSASNYSFMYTLFRILDEVNPKNILELGLGQTSKMTTQYANFYKDSNLMVIDSDQDWIDVFCEKLDINENIKIIQVDTELFIYNDTENLRYANLNDVVDVNKFDLIIIDGPQGYLSEPSYRELDYSRSNIWSLIDNLADDFVIIIIDDFNRVGEKRTIEHLHELLKERNIKFFNFKSSGIKEQFVVCSEKYRFISWF